MRKYPSANTPCHGAKLAGTETIAGSASDLLPCLANTDDSARSVFIGSREV